MQLLPGKVGVTFRIDVLGQEFNYRLTQRSGRSCDEQALRIARIISPTWVPARMGLHAAMVEYELPFIFRMGGC